MTTPGRRSEPQPGAPGGTAGGPRSATAATFQVNDSSLRELRKTWQGLTQDVRAFGKAIDDLKRGEKTLESIQAKLGNLGVGGASGHTSGAGNARPAGARAVGMPSAPPAPTGPGYHPEAGPAAAGRPVRQQGASMPGMGWAAGAGATVGRIAGAAFSAQGAFVASRMGDISDLNLLFNRQAQNSGYGYRNSERDVARNAFFGAPGGQGPGSGIMGYQSAGDLMQGAATLGTPSGLGLSNVGMQRLRNAGQMSGLRPESGLAGAAAASASLYDPTVSNRAMSMGIGPTLGGGGRNMTPAQVYSRIIQTVFRGQRPTANQITEGLLPGAPLYMTLTQGLGLGPDAIAEFERYGVAQANLNGNAQDTQRAITAASRLMSGTATSDLSKRDQQLVRQSGLEHSVRANQNALGAAGARMTVETERQTATTLEVGFGALADATDKVTAGFSNLNGALGAVLPGNNPLGVTGGIGALAAGPVGAALGALGGVGGAMFAWQQWGGRRNRRGAAGGGGGGVGGVAGDVAEGVLGGGVQKVFVVNMGMGGMGGGPGGPGGAPGAPGGGGRGGRFGRLARGAGRFAVRGGGAALAGGAAFLGTDFLADQAEEQWGERDENGNRSTIDRLGKSAATVGKYAATGAAVGSVIPVAGTAVGAVAGTVIGSGKSIWDWYKGDNQKNDERPKRERDEARDPQGQPRMPNTPFFSLNDPTPGGSADFGYARGRGGAVPGNHDNDTVPIRATPGEVVVPKNVVRKYGGAEKLMTLLGFLQTAGGRNGHYAQGGVVSPTAADHRQKQPAALPSAGSVTGDTEGIHPEFMRRLKAWSAAVGTPYKIGSGYRSLEEQKRLYDRWMRRVPGQAPAAKPGSSNHNFGLASDGPHWRGKNPEKFGLRYPMSYEPWHVEPVGAKEMRNGVVTQANLPSAAEGTGAPIPPGRNLVQAVIPGIESSEKSVMARLLSSVGLSSGGSVQHWARRTAEPTATDAAGAAVTAPPGAASGAPSNPGGNAAIGKAMAAQRGWTGAEWDALYQLWQGESGWKHTADNPGSSAYGIPQALIHLHKMPAGYYDKKTGSGARTQGHGGDPAVQIAWGLDYIKGRYSTPSKAYATWKSRNPHWYEKGAWDVPENDHPAILHKEEMVVPAHTARRLRQAVKNRGAQNAMPSAPIPVQGSGGRAQVLVQLTAPITLAGRATREDAAHFVDMVTSKMEENDVLASLGSGS